MLSSALVWMLSGKVDAATNCLGFVNICCWMHSCWLASPRLERSRSSLQKFGMKHVNHLISHKLAFKEIRFTWTFPLDDFRSCYRSCSKIFWRQWCTGTLRLSLGSREFMWKVEVQFSVSHRTSSVSILRRTSWQLHTGLDVEQLRTVSVCLILALEHTIVDQPACDWNLPDSLLNCGGNCSSSTWPRHYRFGPRCSFYRLSRSIRFSSTFLLRFYTTRIFGQWSHCYITSTNRDFWFVHKVQTVVGKYKTENLNENEPELNAKINVLASFCDEQSRFVRGRTCDGTNDRGFSYTTRWKVRFTRFWSELRNNSKRGEEAFESSDATTTVTMTIVVGTCTDDCSPSGTDLSCLRPPAWTCLISRTSSTARVPCEPRAGCSSYGNPSSGRPRCPCDGAACASSPPRTPAVRPCARSADPTATNFQSKRVNFSGTRSLCWATVRFPGPCFRTCRPPTAAEPNPPSVVPSACWSRPLTYRRPPVSSRCRSRGVSLVFEDLTWESFTYYNSPTR